MFEAELTFPGPGAYHIYADAAPARFGQQVFRFDVAIGINQLETHGPAGPMAVREEIVVTSGDYSVRLDVSQLSADREVPLGIGVLKDGHPAEDLAPYLGVSAHAVLIRAEDLAYVHAHPTIGGSADTGTSAHLDSDDSNQHAKASDTHSTHEHDHGNGTSTEPGGTVSPEMMLHLTPPGSGRYTLFLEFIGAGEVHTIAVPIDVPAVQ